MEGFSGDDGVRLSKKCEWAFGEICDVASFTWEKGTLVVLVFFVAGHWSEQTPFALGDGAGEKNSPPG